MGAWRGGLGRVALLASCLALAQLAGALAAAREGPEHALHPGRDHQRFPSAAAAATAAAAAAASAANATIAVDLAQTRPVSPLLYGIFFEEIGHAGDGGLYAELVQDRSFDAIAKAAGFISPSPASSQAASADGVVPLRLPVSLSHLAAQQARRAEAAASSNRCSCAAGRRRKQSGGGGCGGGNDIIVAWEALPGTRTTLTKEQPLNPNNLVAMELAGPPSSADGSSAAGPAVAGILNSGYWGVPVQANTSYSLSIFLRTPGGAPARATVSLLPSSPADPLQALASPLASASFEGLTASWQRFSAELSSGANDTQARLAVTFEGPGTLVVNMVSLFPSANTQRGQQEGLANAWPFRSDLLGALKALRPSFLRFPGGCYVEGDWLSGAFRWKTTVGPDSERPGHHNSMWGYWSTDGLGLFEYMLLAEELGAEPIWVVNNGIAHNDQVPTRDIWPWVQEALDGIEFISGPANSTWGRVRAAMGRPQPWALNYLAIGNEGCGLPWDVPNPNYRPFYWQNYLAFYGALKAAHPHLNLIANCQLGDLGPAPVWEYHVYTSPADMFSRRRAFDGMDPGRDGLVFASEYAVTDGGGHGNVQGAVAEAAFMLGMERNSYGGHSTAGSAGGTGVVLAGSYAPLFVNANQVPWPTNMIVFDNHRHYAIPSFHVQRMLAAHLGTHHIATEISGPDADSLEAGASCLTAPCDEVAVKVVNFSPDGQRVALSIRGLSAGSLGATGDLVTLGSEHPLEENSFEEPRKITPHNGAISGVGERFELPLSPWSLTIVKLRIVPPSA